MLHLHQILQNAELYEANTLFVMALETNSTELFEKALLLYNKVQLHFSTLIAQERNADKNNATIAWKIVDIKIISTQLHLLLYSNKLVDVKISEFNALKARLQTYKLNEMLYALQQAELALAKVAEHLSDYYFEAYETINLDTQTQQHFILVALDYMMMAKEYYAYLSLETRLGFLNILEQCCRHWPQQDYLQLMSEYLIDPSQINSLSDQMEMLSYHHAVVSQGGFSTLDLVSITQQITIIYPQLDENAQLDFKTLYDSLNNTGATSMEIEEEEIPSAPIVNSMPIERLKSEINGLIRVLLDQSWGISLKTKEQNYFTLNNQILQLIELAPRTALIEQEATVYLTQLRMGYELTRDPQFLTTLNQTAGCFLSENSEVLAEVIYYLNTNKPPENGARKRSRSIFEPGQNNISFNGCADIDLDPPSVVAFKQLFDGIVPSIGQDFSSSFAAKILLQIAKLILVKDELSYKFRCLIAFNLLYEARAFNPSDKTILDEINAEIDFLEKDEGAAWAINENHKYSPFKEPDNVTPPKRKERVTFLLESFSDEVSTLLSENNSIEQIDDFFNQFHTQLLSNLRQQYPKNSGAELLSRPLEKAQIVSDFSMFRPGQATQRTTLVNNL